MAAAADHDVFEIGDRLGVLTEAEIDDGPLIVSLGEARGLGMGRRPLSGNEATGEDAGQD